MSNCPVYGIEASAKAISYSPSNSLQLESGDLSIKSTNSLCSGNFLKIIFYVGDLKALDYNQHMTPTQLICIVYPKQTSFQLIECSIFCLFLNNCARHFSSQNSLPTPIMPLCHTSSNASHINFEIHFPVTLSLTLAKDELSTSSSLFYTVNYPASMFHSVALIAITSHLHETVTLTMSSVIARQHYTK